MKLSIIAAFLASISLSVACAGPRPCHDGPPRPNSFSSLKGNRVPNALNMKPLTAPIAIRNAAHRARNAFLEARGYYDDDVDLGRLYARDAEFDDGVLYGRDAEGYDLFDLETRDWEEEYVNLLMNGKGRSSSRGAGGPLLPAGLDSREYHMFSRLDTIPKAYPPVGSIDHAGLNKLMADLGGQHVDVVYGNPAQGYRECGLILVDMAWTETHSNADGYPVVAQCRRLYPGEMDKYTYIGQYAGGSVEKLSKALINGRTYNHRSFHCGTFTEQLFRVMGLR